MRYFVVESFYSSLDNFNMTMILIIENGNFQVWCSALDICRFLGYRNVEQSLHAIPVHLKKHWGDLNIDRGNKLEWMLNLNALVMMLTSLKKSKCKKLMEIYYNELLPYMENLIKAHI